MDRVDLKALPREELKRWMVHTLGDDAARADRVFQRIWQDGITRFEQMHGVARQTKQLLAERGSIPQLQLERQIHSRDGSTKYLWRLHDGAIIESVLIPDGRRLTLCMSSQVGCAMACKFCVTGDMGLKRHLSASEIADQALQVQLSLPDGMRLTNLVFMGMGEPLHNLEALIPALKILLDDHGMNFSHRRVTVSTVGLVPKMAELAKAVPVNLAISLNATTEEQRRTIMPLTRKWSLESLMDAARVFPLPPGKRITFEYVMFAGFNDTLEDAARLYALLEGIPAKLNLIPYNENEHYRDLRRPSDDTVKAFQHYFVSRGLSCSIRTTRGLDIGAACGQLGRAHGRAAAV